MQWPATRESQTWQEWGNLLIRILQGAFAKNEAEVGAIQEFVAVPQGWALANGAIFDATSLPILKQKLGGTTLPNLTTAYPASGLKVCIKLG